MLVYLKGFKPICYLVAVHAIYLVVHLKGSMPLVGSSSSTNRGDPMRAMARHNFRFIPPERAIARVFFLSNSPTSFMS